MLTTFISPSKHLGQTIKSHPVLSNTALGMSAIVPQERTLQIQHYANADLEISVASIKTRRGTRGLRICDQFSKCPRKALDQLLISLMRSGDAGDIDDANSEIRIPWSSNIRAPTGTVENDGEKFASHNEGLIQSVVRAHAWKRALLDGAHDSVEMLAEANRLHPKVVRQALRLARSQSPQ